MLEVDLTYALDAALGDGRGLSGAALETFAAANGPASGRMDEGPFRGFFDLPLDSSPAESTRAWCAQMPEATDVVLAGIGGSAMSARVFASLRDPCDPLPRLHVLDTVDPARVDPLLASLEPGRTLLVGVSKSGGTLETAATFLLFEAWLQDALGAVASARIAVVCGEQPNPLRARAEARGYAHFAVPISVGGRYSALTPVGLLPAACVGVDPLALLAGAAVARERCLRADLDENPALALAAAHFAAQLAGRTATVLWPYGEGLRPLGPWWGQLVGESLGKRGPGGPTGVTPVAAVGPADQHSLLQLLVEGPDDKLVVFVEAGGVDGSHVPEGASALGPAGGLSLGQILTAQREGTEYALAQAGRPSLTVRLPAVDAASVGAFLMVYQAAVVWWGWALGVDPFGQPGVELGKTAAIARLTGIPADLAADLDTHRDRPRRVSR